MASDAGVDAVPRIRMMIPIWGTEYIERWLDLTFAALRSEGNILYLNQHSDFELAILTMAADVAYLRGDARFNVLTAGIRVRFIAMDEFFPPQGKTPYGVPLTLAYAKGILDLGDQVIGTYVIVFNADVMVATGSFKSVLDRISDGYTAIGAPGLRAIDGRARQTLYGRVDKDTGVLSISPRELMGLANANLHGTVGSRTLNERGPIDTFYFHQLYWRVSEDCIASRGFLIHPLCFRVERMIEKVLCPVDYGFITEMCPNGRFCVLDDSDDFMALELQARDSEGYLLRLAHKGESADRRLARLSDEIAAHAASWTTEEHRRNATFTIYFHEKDLPADIAQRVAPFDALIDGVLARLPPAVSHIGHFQWLPAVHYYRQDMIRGGGDAKLLLLDDPRNLMPPPPATPPLPAVSPVPRVSFAVRCVRAVAHRSVAAAKALVRNGRNWLRLQRQRNRRDSLADLIEARLVVNGPGLEIIYIDHIGDHAKPLRSGARVLDLGNPAGPDNRRDFSVPPSQRDGAGSSEALLIYAPAGFLSLWDWLWEDVEAFFVDYRQVVLVLVQQDFGSLGVADHAYMLSILLSGFPSRKYDVDLDVYLAPEPGRFDIFAALARSALRSIGLRPTKPLHSGAPPARFSALVVSAKRRDRR